MSVLRLLALAFTLAIVGQAAALAQQPHWLIGIWQGELRGIGANPTGSARTFTVRTVSPDGTSAQGTWGTEGGASPVTISIKDQTITFTPPTTSVAPGNNYKLEHKGNTLEGSWANTTGRSGGVTLTKK
jgi:protein-disulfide isomerase